MSAEIIENLTAQIKELKEQTTRQYEEAMREIRSLKEKLGQKQSVTKAHQNAAKQTAQKKDSRRRRDHSNEASVLVLAENRSKEDKEQLIQNLISSDFSRVRPREMPRGDIQVRCKKSDKQSIAETIKAQGWEIGTRS